MHFLVSVYVESRDMLSPGPHQYASVTSPILPQSTPLLSLLPNHRPQKDAEGEHLVMPEDKVDVELLNVAGGELNNALTNPFFGKL